jgi:hypothetical protein
LIERHTLSLFQNGGSGSTMNDPWLARRVLIPMNKIHIIDPEVQYTILALCTHSQFKEIYEYSLG